MATIKLTGLKNGRQATAGDGDEAQIDGDLTIGDGTGEDTVVFNAEINSHIIPNTDISFDLGDPESNVWRNIFGQNLYGETLTITNSNTPASATDTGSAGEIRWDSNYIYVCVADNTWKRVSIATW